MREASTIVKLFVEQGGFPHEELLLMVSRLEEPVLRYVKRIVDAREGGFPFALKRSRRVATGVRPMWIREFYGSGPKTYDHIPTTILRTCQERSEFTSL